MTTEIEYLRERLAEERQARERLRQKVRRWAEAFRARGPFDWPVLGYVVREMEEEGK